MTIKILSAALLSLLLAHPAMAQEATPGKNMPAAKTTPQERAEARAKRQADAKSAMKSGQKGATGEAGDAAVAKKGPATTVADRQAARQKRRAAMTDAQQKHQIPPSNEAK